MKQSNIVVLIICFLSLFFLVRCSNNQPESEGKIAVDLDNRQEVSLFDIFSRVEIIPLETNELSLIKTLGKVIDRNDTLYVSDFERPKILAFNRDGRYLFQIDAMGMGPGEYTGISDFDFCSDSLNILSGIDNKLFIYGSRGNFIRSLRLPEIKGAYRSLNCINEDSIAFWTYDYENRLKFYSKTMNKIYKEQIPIDKDNMSTSIEISVFPVRDYFFRVFDNRAYTITDDSELTVAYEWDFGKLNNTDKMINNTPSVRTQSELMANIEKMNASRGINYYFGRSGGNSQYIYTRLTRKNILINIFHNKETKEIFVFDG